MKTILQVIPGTLAVMDNLETVKTSLTVEILAMVETSLAVEILAIAEISLAVEILAAVVASAVVASAVVVSAAVVSAAVVSAAVVASAVVASAVVVSAAVVSAAVVSAAVVSAACIGGGGIGGGGIGGGGGMPIPPIPQKKNKEAKIFLRPPPPSWEGNRVLGLLVGLFRLDVYGSSNLTKRARYTMEMAAIILTIIFFFDLALWFVLLNLIFNKGGGTDGIVELTLLSPFAGLLAFCLATASIIFEANIFSSDLSKVNYKVLASMAGRVGLVIVAALITAEPLHVMILMVRSPKDIALIKLKKACILQENYRKCP